jgi:hypothetical protein
MQGQMDDRLEVGLNLVILPVSDVDGSLAFYSEQVGFALDVDQILKARKL